MRISSAGTRLAPTPAARVPAQHAAARRTAWVALALMAAGILVWTLSLSSIALSEMSDLGLGSVLPVGIWVSFGLVTAGCVAAWLQGHTAAMTAGVLSTILVLFGLGVAGEPTMRFATTWQHVGIADYVAHHGSVDPQIDAYFNWPGFFVLTAFISKVAGLKNIEPIARVAPLFYNAMYLLPLVAIGQSLFSDRRIVWLGVWLFFVNNWIGQDYYSPQGLAFFMYLVVLAVLLRWFKGRSSVLARIQAMSPGQRISGRMNRLRAAFGRQAKVIIDVPSMPAQRVILIVCLAVISVDVVGSHQLTPFALVSSTTVLVVIGWSRLRTLPLAILLVTLLWSAYMATTYLSGHLHELTSGVGALNSSVNSNVSGRLSGSVGHEQIVKLRLIATGALWLLAGLGFVRSARRKRLVLPLLGLAFAPFPLIALQSYGGEVLLRIALFSMPFMAFSTACLFLPARAEVPMSRWGTAALGCLAVVLLASFPFDRYGNERMDYYPKAELTGVQALYRAAPAGSYVFAADEALPWRYEHYADYFYYGSLETTGAVGVDLDIKDPTVLAGTVARTMRAPQGRHSYLIITQSTNAESDLFGPWKRGAQLRLEGILTRSPLFRTVFRDQAAAVFELRLTMKAPRGKAG